MSTHDLRMQHTSLQFSDKPDQQEHDVRALFEKGEAWPIKSGTEAGVDKVGDNRLRPLLIHFAEKHDHIINFAGDAWVAVDRKIIVPGSVKKEDVFLISNDTMVGHGHDRYVAALHFVHATPGVGHISVGSVHYATKGRVPGDPNYDINRVCAVKIGRWLAQNGHGSNLAFINGDFNIPDARLDFALGENFTSMADELEAWQNTGHGPIDGFCSYDRDGRVKAKRFNVLDDSEFKMFSDHFMCRGTWETRLLKEAS